MRGYTVTSITAFTLVAIVGASPLSGSAGRHRSGSVAPLYTPPNVFADHDGFSAAGADSHVIPDSYIVVLKESHGHHLPYHLNHLESLHPKRNLLTEAAHGVAHHFDIGALKGYAGKFSQETLEWIRSHGAVEFVERDSIVKAMDIERGAPWGLARISHRKPLSLSTLGKYEYEHNDGKGVDVYVIDTGININHVEFEGRAKWGKTMAAGAHDFDGNGHGTHCAGTIASRKYGVAKSANLIAVKVLSDSGSGSMSDVVGGVAWAAQQATAKVNSQEARDGTHKGSVASMSLGGGKSPSLDLVVNNSVKKGLHFAVAAGNDNRDAKDFSPAAAELAITVGASTIADSRAYFSNFGKTVDIFAPGLNILSTWNTGNTSVNTISGTSMATPHIAGLAAAFLSEYPGKFSPSEEDYAAAGVPFPSEEETNSRSLFSMGRQLVFGAKKQASAYKAMDPKVLKTTMIRLSSKGILSQIPTDGTPNLLAFNNFTATPSAAEAEEETSTIEEDMEEQLVHIMPVWEKTEQKAEALVQELEAEIEEFVESILEASLE